MGLNTLMEDLQNKLINDINNSQLPVGIVYYIAKDVFSQIENEYQRTLKEEQEQNKSDKCEEIIDESNEN